MPQLKVLHTEASSGWGGQEMRILKEALGMRMRGYECLFAVIEGGELFLQAQQHGFKAYEIPFKTAKAKSFFALRSLLESKKIDLVNTHSSLDAWIGGMAAKSKGRSVIRTRHISSSIRGGLNAYLLYNKLADAVVTTCEETAQKVRHLAKLPTQRCNSIPTGIDPHPMQVSQNDIDAFRASYGVGKDDYLVGTVCILRRWKGVSDFLQAAAQLRHEKQIKWMVIGSGPSEEKYRTECKELGLEDRVIFTGYLSPPYSALAALDVFCLLSTASEGVSQATLQAAYLQKPMITTTVGGLKEVCLDGQTGFHVPPFAPKEVASKVAILCQDNALRQKMGGFAKNLVEQHFTFERTLDDMEKIYRQLFTKDCRE